MILGEIAREERVLVIVTRARDGMRPLYAVPHSLDGSVIALTVKPQPCCLFENRDLAERTAFELEKWGLDATVRRVSLVTSVEDARPEL